MPPLGGKSKSKGREARQSRSRNTTPSSVVSASMSISQSNPTPLDTSLGNLVAPESVSYDEILEKHGGTGGIPDPKHLELLANDLKVLSQVAETRGAICDGGMREVSKQRKERLEEERELEQASREAEEKESLKRAIEEDEDIRARKGGKLKRRREKDSIREERPLTHGAHGLARQDGVTVATTAAAKPREPQIPSKGAPSPRKLKREAVSGSSSSLSPTSQILSPMTNNHPRDADSARDSSASSDSSIDSHQPPPAPSIPQYQTFGPDPTTFDDPTIYHVCEVTADMSDTEKKEIYCVNGFPKDDLSHLIAGTPPDKDFSNAKPTNQVNANTFATFIEPYLRPLTEEDIGFLKERGDRIAPFTLPRRGKRSYTEIWAEEDGSISLDHPQTTQDTLPPNEPRGSIDDMDDEAAETDQISAGPVLNRFLSLMRFEHRASPGEEKEKLHSLTNGTTEHPVHGMVNGENHGEDTIGEDKPERIPPATSMPEITQQNSKGPTIKLDHAQVDERLKVELRYLGFLNPDIEPDYDAHFDDDVAERLRALQSELKNQIIVNGARKARVLELAQMRLAHQEYSGILEDQDSQVQQAYLKRTRTLGKSKSKIKRPGGAGGGSHYVLGANTAGITKPGIGDVAKQVMQRRQRWMDVISPVFDENTTRVRGADEGIFDPDIMEPFMQAERERWDEEAE